MFLSQSHSRNLERSPKNKYFLWATYFSRETILWQGRIIQYSNKATVCIDFLSILVTYETVLQFMFGNFENIITVIVPYIRAKWYLSMTSRNVGIISMQMTHSTRYTMYENWSNYVKPHEYFLEFLPLSVGGWCNPTPSVALQAKLPVATQHQNPGDCERWTWKEGW